MLRPVLATLLTGAALVLSGCSSKAPAPAPLSSGASALSAVPYTSTGQVLVSYNSGLQIGNDVLLYRATRKRAYLDDAVKLTQASYRAFGDLTYPIPPGNTIIFGRIYLDQVRTLVPYSKVAADIYRKQSAGYLAYVRAHRTTGGVKPHRWPSGLWRDNNGQRYSWLWPFEVITSAEEDRGDYSGARALKYYWDGRDWRSSITNRARNIRASGDVYWDDDVWAAFDVLAAYRQTHQRSYLSYAVTDFRFLQSGWQHPYGGVKWVDATWNRDITAASTAGSEQVGLLLYLSTHRRWDLQWALGVQQWVDRRLRTPSGLLYDHLTLCKTGLCWSVPSQPGPPHKAFSDPLLYIAAQG